MIVTDRTAARMLTVPITRRATAATARLGFMEMDTTAFLMVSFEILLGKYDLGPFWVRRKSWALG